MLQLIKHQNGFFDISIPSLNLVMSHKVAPGDKVVLAIINNDYILLDATESKAVETLMLSNVPVILNGTLEKIEYGYCTTFTVEGKLIYSVSSYINSHGEKRALTWLPPVNKVEDKYIVSVCESIIAHRR